MGIFQILVNREDWINSHSWQVSHFLLCVLRRLYCQSGYLKFSVWHAQFIIKNILFNSEDYIFKIKWSLSNLNASPNIIVYTNASYAKINSRKNVNDVGGFFKISLGFYDASNSYICPGCLKVASTASAARRTIFIFLLYLL